MEGWFYRLMDGWTDWWMDRWQMNKQMDGWNASVVCYYRKVFLWITLEDTRIFFSVSVVRGIVGWIDGRMEAWTLKEMCHFYLSWKSSWVILRVIVLVWCISWEQSSSGRVKRREEIKSSSLPGGQDSCGAIGFADGSPARAFTHGCFALCMGDSTLSNPRRAIKVQALKAGGLTPLSLPPLSHSTMHQSHGLRNTEKEREASSWSHVPLFFFLPIKVRLNKAGVCKNWIHQPGHVEQMSRLSAGAVVPFICSRNFFIFF